MPGLRTDGDCSPSRSVSSSSIAWRDGPASSWFQSKISGCGGTRTNRLSHQNAAGLRSTSPRVGPERDDQDGHADHNAGNQARRFGALARAREKQANEGDDDDREDADDEAAAR